MRYTRIVVALTLAAAVIILPEMIRAQDEPEKPPVGPIVDKIMQDEGIGAAVEKLRGLRADSADVYAFSRGQMSLAARWLIGVDRRDEGLALMEQITEMFPESVTGWFELGWQYLLSTDSARARECMTRTLELTSDSYYFNWVIENFNEFLRIARIQTAIQSKYAPGENTGIQGPYLGEEPPGRTPKVFAPGLVCGTPNEFSITFSPDGREIYFSRSMQGVLVCRWEEDGWTAAEPVDFFGYPFDVDEASVAPDGQSVLFNARPTFLGEREIYRAERVGEGWGKPEKLFPGMYATATLDGAIYATVTTGRPDYGVIGKYVPTDSGYGEAEIVGGGVNSERLDAHPWIAPDESFILFDSNRDDYCSLFVCYRNQDGTWGDAICLNEHLNIPPFAGQCALSPDGKYLFYSMQDNMYWVSAEFLEELRPK
ncbi:MAG TPA: hypothetical protein VM118_03450 [Acidobacteriota bacterium]|nr:hypothetical protein [Acidobacteriota bacterium]